MAPIPSIKPPVVSPQPDLAAAGASPRHAAQPTEEMYCPILMQIFVDPHIAQSGKIYEKVVLERILNRMGADARCPLTTLPISSIGTPASGLKSKIEDLARSSAEVRQEIEGSQTTIANVRKNLGALSGPQENSVLDRIVGSQSDGRPPLLTPMGRVHERLSRQTMRRKLDVLKSSYETHLQLGPTADPQRTKNLEKKIAVLEAQLAIRAKLRYITQPMDALLGTRREMDLRHIRQSILNTLDDGCDFDSLTGAAVRWGAVGAGSMLGLGSIGLAIPVAAAMNLAGRQPSLTMEQASTHSFVAGTAVIAVPVMVVSEPLVQAAAVPSAVVKGLGNLLGMAIGRAHARRAQRRNQAP